MQKKGVALLLALFTLVIVSLLVVAFFELTTIDFQIISNHYNRNKALYIADAGIEYVVYQLRNNRLWSRPLNNPLVIQFPVGSGNTYSVTYPSVSGIITSIGTLVSGEKAIVQVKVSVTGAARPFQVKILFWKEP